MHLQESKVSPEEKVVFSKEVDDKINGFAVAFSFIFIGLFLLLYPGYFTNKLVSTSVRWLFIIFGAIGMACEVGRLKSDNAIKGIGILAIGFVLLGLWLVCFLVANAVLNVIAFPVLIFGLYGASRGLIEVMYSFRLQRKSQDGAKGKAITAILLLLTQLASFALVILQLVKALTA